MCCHFTKNAMLAQMGRKKDENWMKKDKNWMTKDEMDENWMKDNECCHCTEYYVIAVLL
jgi:hypothetical protein